MGNEITKCCGKSQINQEDSAQIYFEKPRSKPKSTSQNPVLIIQTWFRRCSAKEKLNIMIQTLQRVCFENIGRSVNLEEIKARRGKVLSTIEESFKENHKEGIQLKNYFQDFLSDNITSKSRHRNIYVPNLLISSQEIYDGYWELDHSQGIFSYNRMGYGNLYMEDGTKIEGIFEGDTMIKKGVIYHSNGKIYIGEITIINDEQGRKYKEHGQGCSYHFTDKLLKQTIKGTWKEGKLTGNCIIDNIDKFTLNCEFVDGNICYQKGIFNYTDGSSYEGEFNNHFHKHGQGKCLYSNGHSYEGCWKKDKYHGAGLLFKTDDNLDTMLINADENNNQIDTKLTSKGTLIEAIWMEGLLHGKGLSTVNKKVTENFWRFGKLIHAVSKLGSNKIILNENIFTFLNFQEKLELLKLHNKNISTQLTKNNNEFKFQIKLLKIGSGDIEDYPFLIKKQIKHKKPPSYFNNYLLDNLKSLTNLNDIIDNYPRKIPKFIPIVAYFTNGGLVQKRLHYSNTFTPDLRKAFSSNYLYQKKNNIIVGGVLSANIYEANRTIDKKEEIENPDKLEYMLKKATEYLPRFEGLKQEYKYDLNKFYITDTNVLNKCQSENGDCIFTVDNIIIDIPIKLSLYTILGNPVRTLAVYIHSNPCGNTEDIINHSLIESMEPIDNKDNLDNLISRIKSDYAPIKINNNEKNIIVEFDTQEQHEKNRNGMQLLALIILKDYSEPHVISFKKYYHLGKYVTVKLIDQSTVFSYKKAGIDIGSILFFGEIYKLHV